MDTQPTQHGLMQIFTRLGLASNHSLPSLEGQGETDKGFAGLLSGYLPSDAEQSTSLTAEGLPLLGQTLPLEATMQPTELSVEDISVLAPTSDLELAVQRHDESSEWGASEAPVIKEEVSTQAQALQEQGFYAQSLVSSLVLNNTNSRLTQADETAPVAALSIATESATTPYPSIAPQNIVNNASVSTTTLTASELDEMNEQSVDRFLGAEPASSVLKPKKPVSLELFPASQTATPLSSPATVEASISLALARNEDPTTQTLNELVDGETLEKGELEAKLTTLERKQDDQTLKLNKGQQAWGDALMERISMNAAKDIKQVTIHLDPPELGSLELKLQVKDDQQTQVQVQVQHPQVKEALESSAHRLRDMLASQGLELSEFDVQTDAGRGDQFAGSEDQQRQGEAQDSDALQNTTEEISIEIQKPKNNNILDTFV